MVVSFPTFGELCSPPRASICFERVEGIPSCVQSYPTAGESYPGGHSLAGRQAFWDWPSKWNGWGPLGRYCRLWVQSQMVSSGREDGVGNLEWCPWGTKSEKTRAVVQVGFLWASEPPTSPLSKPLRLPTKGFGPLGPARLGDPWPSAGRWTPPFSLRGPPYHWRGPPYPCRGPVAPSGVSPHFSSSRGPPACLSGHVTQKLMARSP